MPVENWTPCLLDELDDSCDAGGEHFLLLIVHRCRERDSACANRLEHLPGRWIIFGKELLLRVQGEVGAFFGDCFLMSQDECLMYVLDLLGAHLRSLAILLRAYFWYVDVLFLPEELAYRLGGVGGVDCINLPALTLDDTAFQVKDDLDVQVRVALSPLRRCGPPAETAAKVHGDSRKMLQEGSVVRAGFAVLLHVLLRQLLPGSRQSLASARF